MVAVFTEQENININRAIVNIRNSNNFHDTDGYFCFPGSLLPLVFPYNTSSYPFCTTSSLSPIKPTQTASSVLMVLLP